MDPSKSFDHLDPKLKETYARVMGTATNDAGSITQNPTSPSVSPDPVLSATPTSFDPIQPSANAAQTMQPSTMNTGPNPGTGPSINTMPNNASSNPTSDPNSPSTASFFSNPSPATSDLAQTQTNENNVSTPVGAPAATPVTPYTPEGFNSAPQPLPSPSSVNQQAEHQTSPLLKVLYIIGAVIFFAIYTIFWIKIFNLPFLF